MVFTMLPTAPAPEFTLPASSAAEGELDLTAVWSTDHEESPRVMSGIKANINSSGLVEAKGKGCNYVCSNSLQIWAGANLKNGTGSVAFVHVISGNQVNFAVIQARLLDAGYCAVPGSCVNLGGGKYINTKEATWVAAWTMTKTIGKGKKDPSDFLSVGAGLENWLRIQQLNGLYIPLLAVFVP